jgi:hypothetical protein
MDAMVKFHPAQEVPSSELNFLQESVRTTMDGLVRRLLVRSVYYTQLVVTKSSSVGLSVGAGRFYSNGALYVKTVDTPINVTSYLPAGGQQKILAIVASGQQIDEEAEPRKFLVDPNTRSVRARTVETRNKRNVVIGVVEGVASSTPTAPVVDAGYATIALVTLSSTGIVGEPAQQLGQIAPNLEDLVAKVQVIDAELEIQLGMIRTLRTDLTGLWMYVRNLPTRADIDALWAAIRDILKRFPVDPTNPPTLVGYDDFDNLTKSDTGHASYSADVQGGRLLPPRPASTSILATLLNPIDSRVKTDGSNALTLPDYDIVVRFANVVKDEEVGISTYPVVTKNKKMLTQSIMLKYREVNDLSFKKAYKKGDGVVALINPETGNPISVNLKKYNWKEESVEKWGSWIFIEDWNSYWSEFETTNDVTGATIAQTYLNAQGGWLTDVSVHVSNLGPSGDMRLVICETKTDGTPDLTRSVTEVLVPYATVASMVTQGTNSEAGWCRFAVPICHLAAGKRYALVIQTAGTHKLWASSGNSVANGTSFYATDDNNWTSLNKDIAFKLRFAQFKATWLAVELGPVSLVGGIDSLDFVFTGTKPGAARFDVQAQVAGVWRTIDADDETVFSTQPTLVPLRAVWQSTKDEAVGIILPKSRIFAGRTSLSGTHISTVWDMPGAATAETIVVKQILTGFNDAVHDHVISIRHGASFATVAAAASVVDTVLSDGTTERKATFDFTGAEIPDWKIQTAMTLSSSQAEYAVLRSEFYAV